MNDKHEIAHQLEPQLEPVARDLDRLAAAERASMPPGLATRIAERTAPLIAGRVKLVEAEAPRVHVRFGALALAASVAVVVGVAAVFMAMRPAPTLPAEEPGRLAQVTLNDLDEFLAYGKIDNEVESLFVETELLSVTIGVEGSGWMDEAFVEESL